MPFQPGQSGNPEGRKPGSKNKRTLNGEELCEANEFNSMLFLITVAKDESLDMSFRLKAAIEINGCMFPKLKAVEHTGMDGEPLQNKYVVEIVDPRKREDSEEGSNDSP